MDAEDKEHLRRISGDLREIKQAAQFVLALFVLASVGALALVFVLNT